MLSRSSLRAVLSLSRRGSCRGVRGARMASTAAAAAVPPAAASAGGARVPVIIDGNATAATMREELRATVAGLVSGGGRSPGLAVVLVGNRPDSATYVRMKKKACAEVGILDLGRDLPVTATQAEVLAVVAELNADASVDGILVQLPVPAHIDEATVLDAISHDKGCIELLKRYNIPIEGRHAVVLGRSNIVGIPASQLLLQENATVTVCHSRTRDLPAVVREADILVAAIGKPNFVKGDWLKDGAVVIDVGINSVPDATKKSGQRLVGDVDYESAIASGRVAAITPVPGGVGPMTIAMLLTNTVRAFERGRAGGAGASASA